MPGLRLIQSELVPQRCAFAEGEVHVVQVGEDRRQYDDVMGELSISGREARKRFTQFLRTETRSLGSDEPYSAQLMRQKGQNRVLDVNLQDVKQYDDVLGQLLEEQPNTYLPVVRCRSMTCCQPRLPRYSQG